ncbi:hypothetical protein GCM10010274_05730 [Streptomyces lavendofoliae]|uniref:Uncharacterized protein n=1 Tax=Streptomyces lavendofoliae TaxID=67314 RepID=A0A918HSZ6_9ACTN|nr:hypothetical protein GCM10010274_05730 [Streptomyces lavendofoliae]
MGVGAEREPRQQDRAGGQGHRPAAAGATPVARGPRTRPACRPLCLLAFPSALSSGLLSGFPSAFRPVSRLVPRTHSHTSTPNSPSHGRAFPFRTSLPWFR